MTETGEFYHRSGHGKHASRSWERASVALSTQFSPSPVLSGEGIMSSCLSDWVSDFTIHIPDVSRPSVLLLAYQAASEQVR